MTETHQFTNSNKDDSNAFSPLLRLSGHSLIYGIGIIVRQVFVYLAVPLFTRSMSLPEYGVVAVMSSYLAFLNVLTNVGVPAATLRLYNDNADKENQRLVLATGQQLTMGFAFIAGLLMFLFAADISAFVFRTRAYAAVVQIAAIQLFVESLVNYGVIMLRIQVRPMANNLQSITHGLAQLAFALFFVVRLNLGALGYFYGFTAGAVVGLIYMLWLVRDVIVREISLLHISEMLKFGLPLLPSTLALWALNMSDRAIISWKLGLDSAAVYDVGYRIGLIAGVSLLPINAAWGQLKFSMMNKPNAREIYKNSLTFFLFLFLFSALFVIAIQKPLVAILSPGSYGDALKVVAWVAFSQVVWGAYFTLSIGLHIAKKPGYISMVSIVSAVVNILLNLALIPIMGIVGAAVATLGGYVALSVGTYIVGQRFYPFPLDWIRLGKLAFAGSFSMLALWLVEPFPFSLPLDIALHAFGLFLFPGILILAGFLSREQVKVLWQTTLGILRNKLSVAKR